MTNEINLLSLFHLQLSGKLIQNARGFYVQKRDRMESHKKSGVEWSPTALFMNKRRGHGAISHGISQIAGGCILLFILISQPHFLLSFPIVLGT